MLILKYFLVVGAVLTAGLIALNAHLLPAGSTVPAMAHSATSASLPTVAPKAQPADTDWLLRRLLRPQRRPLHRVVLIARIAPPPLGSDPGCSAGPFFCRNVTAPKFKMAPIVCGALAH